MVRRAEGSRGACSIVGAAGGSVWDWGGSLALVTPPTLCVLMGVWVGGGLG